MFLQKDPPGEFFLTGLDARAGIPAFGDFTVEPKTVARSIRGFIRDRRSLDFASRLLRERIFYPVPDGRAFGLPVDCVDEEAAIEEIFRRVSRDVVLFGRLSLSVLRNFKAGFVGRTESDRALS